MPKYIEQEGSVVMLSQVCSFSNSLRSSPIFKLWEKDEFLTNARSKRKMFQGVRNNFSFLVHFNFFCNAFLVKRENQCNGAMTLSITTLGIMSLSMMMPSKHNNTRHNDTQYNDTQQSNYRHNDTQHNDTQNNDT
jgi:hypothetical protein